MADETIRRLFDKIDDLTKHLTRLEAIMMESVIKKQDSTEERLNSHSQRIRKLEQTKTAAITIKNVFIWGASTLLASVTVSIAIIKFVAGG
ncbi:hypothetical protein [Phascolarctobacterium faecium]|uniref:hypothetical protein n=1 Tax=Phascolarctobacterium faecium TaxID=33025 RepID=UPI0035222980